MPWKMNGQQIEVKDGNPVWIGDDGKESGFDAGEVLKRLTEVTGESIGRKTKIREMETQLEILNGIDDPKDFMAKAKKAMDTVKNLDDKQLVDAGKVAEIKKDLETKLAESQKLFESELKKRDDALELKQKAFADKQLETIFEQSKFFPEKTHMTPDVAFSLWKKNFKPEENADGSISFIAIDNHGNEITSADVKRLGKPATPEEAMESLFNAYPRKDDYLKGTTPGSGTPPGGQYNRNQDLSKLSPIEKINAARQV